MFISLSARSVRLGRAEHHSRPQSVEREPRQGSIPSPALQRLRFKRRGSTRQCYGHANDQECLKSEENTALGPYGCASSQALRPVTSQKWRSPDLQNYPRRLNNPTESVTYQASVLSAMVVMATAMEAHSNRLGVNHRTGNRDIMVRIVPSFFSFIERFLWSGACCGQSKISASQDFLRCCPCP
jgi:hypothetical protein